MRREIEKKGIACRKCGAMVNTTGDKATNKTGIPNVVGYTDSMHSARLKGYSEGICLPCKAREDGSNGRKGTPLPGLEKEVRSG